MTSDQKAYYLAQFLRLQHDPSGYLSGQAAKAFFELSKLPVSNLSQIWELSDVDADGQLSLSEFSVAMHLVVLCRNGVILPTQLPESLLRVATSSALSTPVPPQPPKQPLSPTPVEGPEKSPANLPTTAVERRSKLGEHRSFDSTLSEFTVATGVTSHRRWSASSPSTDTDGITSFDGRLVPNDQVRHPIAIRANPAPLNSGTLPTAPRAPTPPPRARAKTLTSDIVSRPHPSLQNPAVHVTTMLPIHQGTAPAAAPSILFSQADQSNSNSLAQQLTAALLPLQNECECIMRENNALTAELMSLQKRRIALEILLERLTPL
ncbi:unnamed protein product [Hymenolepis diminuta]|uniref:EF-hand domain-containing protein n=1 Tax=Hymenolepis diminuta TaxID=6216 RepID=A0A564Z341_HYMDI|nr:unnamed protein product [Hymenolepis diminuta]